MVALHQHPAVFLQCPGVGRERVLGMQLMPAQMMHERRLFPDPPGACMLLDQAEMGFRTRQDRGQPFFQIAADLGRIDIGDGAGKIDARAPRAERRHRRQTRHVPAVVARGEAGEAPAVVLRHMCCPTGDDEARREALDIPFEGGRQGFVEIVDVKDGRPFGRRVAAKIGEVAVAA